MNGDSFGDLADLEDELSRVLSLAADLDPEDVAETLEREAFKLRHPEILQGEILDPEVGND